ncbi:MAG: (2Fe-2S)-binding protein [Pseudolabrys sp.]|jgi:aerobic-type carbon monoxide dehydrogenase small subunit (CoxS/CutS family)
MLEIEAGEKTTIRFTLNGKPVQAQAESRMQLADLLRHVLKKYGTHVGCEHGICGACTVLVDGRAVRSCLMFAAQVEGASVVTVEGLSNATGGLSELQAAFRRHHALQCGFCTPGILASATQFLQDNNAPSEHEVRDMLSGHICRCTGYTGIVEAILMTAQKRGGA